jgi:aspartyl-tRNA(Asn)/glutamyl-tRNA(Gln) amidotransferase subunit B
LDLNNKYEAVIGLEVHAQMKTKSKAFCGCSTEFNAPPNTNVCPVCLGHPGTLPVLNKNLVEFILRLGIALNCKIREYSIFARKNYFYPDLPKGYQISQYDQPICYDGYLNLNGSKIGITRIHMEEDAGKSIHDFSTEKSLVDLNRCGVPLIEIVSEPDIKTPKQAYDYLTSLKQILLYLEICDGNMEEGSLRCDANVSVKLKESDKFGTKCEVKNLNSFKNVMDSLEYEIKRQTELLENGKAVIHQTMTYDAKTKTTSPMRSKEEAHDYRYFPEPDLVKVHADENWINRIKNKLPELPQQKLNRFKDYYGLPDYDAEVLTQSKQLADFYEDICRNLDKNSFKHASNFVMVDVLKILNEEKIDIQDYWVSSNNISNLIKLISEGTVTKNLAKEIYNEMLKVKDNNSEKQNPEYIMKSKNLVQLDSSEEINNIIEKVIEENSAETQRYRSGETKLLGFFVGLVMKQTKGKANPKTVNELLIKKLNEKQLNNI